MHVWDILPPWVTPTQPSHSPTTVYTVAALTATDAWMGGWLLEMWKNTIFWLTGLVLVCLLTPHESTLCSTWAGKMDEMG